MNAVVQSRSTRKPVESVADDSNSQDWRDYDNWDARLWATYGSIDYPAPSYVTDEDVIVATGCAG
jgi:hypothetical protein